MDDYEHGGYYIDDLIAFNEINFARKYSIYG